jgi:hypothetical protein
MRQRENPLGLALGRGSVAVLARTLLNGSVFFQPDARSS